MDGFKREFEDSERGLFVRTISVARDVMVRLIKTIVYANSESIVRRTG